MPAGESATSIRIVSDAAGRIRFEVPWLRASPGRAVAIEDAVDRVLGVRADTPTRERPQLLYGSHRHASTAPS